MTLSSCGWNVGGGGSDVGGEDVLSVPNQRPTEIKDRYRFRTRAREKKKKNRDKIQMCGWCVVECE